MAEYIMKRTHLMDMLLPNPLPYKTNLTFNWNTGKKIARVEKKIEYKVISATRVVKKPQSFISYTHFCTLFLSFPFHSQATREELYLKTQYFSEPKLF